MRTTITALADRLQTEADAYEYLEELRWAGMPICPHCGYEAADYIAPANGVSRRTRTGAMSQRRVWRCRGCRKQFSVLTGTPLHGTKISVRMWVFVIFEMCASKNGVAAREIERKYGLCPRTAWFMMHRIREMMKGEGPLATMRGTIVADETWIGGSLQNQHRNARKMVPYVPGRPHGDNKTPVLALINADTGEAHTAVLPDVTGKNLRKAIAERVDISGSRLMTDEAASYRTFSSEFISHESVNHEAGEYVRGRVSTNKAENFFSQLKRSIDGTHHHISREHLPRYLVEFTYRYNTRKVSDTARMAMLVGRTPQRRLSYKRVAASSH